MEKKINVLSLFDGCSGGHQALERAEIDVDTYYASEIDKYAIQVTMANYPDTIQLGSVVDINALELPKIDILLGGSPCQSFSFAGKRKGMSTKDEQEILTLQHYLQLKSEGYEFEGQSYLFWEYMRILEELRVKNPNVLFLLENVEMGAKWEKVLSNAIGVRGIHINSALVSAQNRKRIYWINWGMKPMGLFGDMESIIEQPKDRGILLKDILETEVDEKYFLSEKFDNWLNKHSKKTGNEYKKTEGNRKAGCLSVSALTGTNPKREKELVERTDGKIGALLTSQTPDNLIKITNAVEIREVKQLSTNNKSNGGTQPYQQDRIYDIDGISPALSAGKSDLLITSGTLRTHKDGEGFRKVQKSVNLSADFILDNKQIIVHNTQRRDQNRPSIQKNKNAGGSGHLSRNDGKTYCLDGGNTNAVEIVALTEVRTEQAKQIRRESGKGATIPARAREDGSGQNVVSINSRIRRLTPIECERLQTVADNYTASVSDSQRYKQLGNGWTIEVISYLFKHI